MIQERIIDRLDTDDPDQSQADAYDRFTEMFCAILDGDAPDWRENYVEVGPQFKLHQPDKRGES